MFLASSSKNLGAQCCYGHMFDNTTCLLSHLHNTSSLNRLDQECLFCTRNKDYMQPEKIAVQLVSVVNNIAEFKQMSCRCSKRNV